MILSSISAMRLYSTNSPDEFVDFGEAVLRSLPADNGLYMPEHIPALSEAFWEKWQSMSFREMAFQIISTLLQGAIPEDALREIIDEGLDFPAPMHKLDDNRYILELFHGPTLAFKDFGARFMARVMAWLTRNDEQELTVLVATSGDTGGAVASAFYKVPGARVVILYPSGGVSDLQEKQLTTLGENITAIEVDGSFDDCQRMVKTAFLNKGVSKACNLTSANSINISRLIPQMLYYFEAARNLDRAPIFVIPSGNFGNLSALLIARKMGLQTGKIIAATNANDVVPEYLLTAEYKPRPSVPTISNAMDVAAPSNFARMQELFGNQWEAMKDTIQGYSADDEQTLAAVKKVYDDYSYVIDPHGAIGYLAAEDWISSDEATENDRLVILETAHPSKFIDTMTDALGEGVVSIPERLACLKNELKVSVKMAADADGLMSWLLKH